MKIILITIGLLAAVGVVIFSYAVEAVNVELDSSGNLVKKEPFFDPNLYNVPVKPSEEGGP